MNAIAQRRVRFDFENGGGVTESGYSMPAYGFTDEKSGCFIVDPRQSPCGRFTVNPATYGLTQIEADRLITLNRALGLPL